MTSPYPEEKKYTSWNIILAIFIYITMDVEHNETTPAMSFARFHEDDEMVTKKASKVGREGQKSSS